MEEVYVIRLRGVPSATTSSSSSSTVDVHDLVRGASLGLGVLHVIFGLLVVIFGTLRTASAEHEPAETVFGTLFGPVFMATGIAAVMCWKRPFRKLKMKVFLAFSLVSLLSSSAFLVLCFVGLATYHSIPRLFGESPHVAANATLASLGECLVSAASLVTAGGAVWKTWRCCCGGALHRPPSLRQKVIVKTDIVQGGKDEEGRTVVLDEEMVRHVSPHCVVSLRASDDHRDVIKKVERYLDSQDELSFTFSDPGSSLHGEQDFGMESQSWGNEVLALTTEPQSKLTTEVEPYQKNEEQLCSEPTPC
ncbi:hypothetical protein JTE90_007856 [Oedothorax gibbosus]|uniref:Uncharacterized protein n=1 Tax=Oedothorax gibbosus TaxID=931172 RepID=A0AAV6VI36_9ARAC|nr:hypothetical protein JTE90_007856 [Oedothorax gibbosus]